MDKKVNEKIAFLDKYTLSSEKKVEFITDESTILNAPIPEYWKAAFLADTLEDRKAVILGVWGKYLAKELSNTILYLQTYLTEIELMKLVKNILFYILFLVTRLKKQLSMKGKIHCQNQNLVRNLTVRLKI
ncbi:Uncharacterised protein [Streptococcus cristatus]|uniref:Uncharacterized protein n=1 Tax=Streptococcus cristatus TaxID=45634 RepID=A0A512AEN5_STRCR|nr:hypothetical protein SOL01_20320 [Streptococcus cristatus]SQI48429.1 Uncharacterised protein [Streptococcus cristatus]